MLQSVTGALSDDENFIVHIYRNFSSFICFYYSGLDDPQESQNSNEIKEDNYDCQQFFMLAVHKYQMPLKIIKRKCLCHYLNRENSNIYILWHYNRG
jgi:hypothetical protein